MLFTRLRQLQQASDFPFEEISEYSNIAFCFLEGLREALNPEAWETFLEIARMDPRTLYVCGEKNDDPVYQLISNFWERHAKLIEAPHKYKNVLGVAPTESLGRAGAEIVQIRWIPVTIQTQDMENHSDLEEWAQQHSPAGYALLEAMEKSEEIGRSTTTKTELIELLIKAGSLLSNLI